MQCYFFYNDPNDSHYGLHILHNIENSDQHWDKAVDWCELNHLLVERIMLVETFPYEALGLLVPVGGSAPWKYAVHGGWVDVDHPEVPGHLANYILPVNDSNMHLFQVNLSPSAANTPENPEELQKKETFFVAVRTWEPLPFKRPVRRRMPTDAKAEDIHQATIAHNSSLTNAVDKLIKINEANILEHNNLVKAYVKILGENKQLKAAQLNVGEFDKMIKRFYKELGIVPHNVSFGNTLDGKLADLMGHVWSRLRITDTEDVLAE